MSSSSSDESDGEKISSGDDKVNNVSTPTKQGKTKKTPWLTEDIKQLIYGVIAQIPSYDLTPWDRFEVDFDKLDSKFSSEECRRKWGFLIKQIRHYRTFKECAEEILLRHEVVNTTVTEWNKDIQKDDKSVSTLKENISRRPSNRTKKTKYPSDYPPKPKTGYLLFLMEKMEILRAEGVSSNQLFSKVSELWKALGEDEQRGYHSQSDKDKVKYLGDMKKYAEEHPDDEHIRSLIKNEERAVEKILKKGTISLDDLDTSRNRSITEYLVKKTRQHEMSDEEDTSKLQNSTLDTFTFLSSPERTKSPKKMKKEQESPMKKRKTEEDSSSSPERTKSPKKMKKEQESPVKKRKTQEDSSSSPRKTPKKKKKKRIWTAVEVFLELKKEAYEMSHPDMEEERLFTKLKGKFAKISDSKKEKYERLADERNTNG